MYLLCTFLVQHIERKPIARVHTTVLAQTAPLAVFVALLTIAKLYLLTSDQEFITMWIFQVLMAYSISIATPLFLIIGSCAKRKAVVAWITCRRNEVTVGRDDTYRVERRSVSMTNAVSMIPPRV
uniref:G_PROTEIN_RECEP_F3_4 domain-containing protein n=1 Tax=Caenorhabditis tropicalis TaxID=1561998 RepID=A0A1I7US34_9PELO